MEIGETTRKQLLIFQKNEITEYHIYKKLAQSVRSPENKEILERIAGEELDHYQYWRSYTQREIKPDKVKMWIYYVISRLFGFTFGAKLMEKTEEHIKDEYEHLRDEIPEMNDVIRAEMEHENTMMQLLDEERLRYMGSIVLGLNDALVELTGALAGLTLALQNTRLIALTGLITGIAAALSMGASEYLSTKSEDNSKNPVKASVYTGTAYVITVFILILPYLLLHNLYLCLGCTLAGALLIIAVFNYYISVAKEIPFRRRFLEMAFLSLGVAAFSFLVGNLIRSFMGIEI